MEGFLRLKSGITFWTLLLALSLDELFVIRVMQVVRNVLCWESGTTIG